MSVSRTWAVSCDAHKVGLGICLHIYNSGEISLVKVREEMRRRGWVRRAHKDFLVDLCYPCSQRAVLEPNPVPNRGRPRKTGVRQ